MAKFHKQANAQLEKHYDIQTYEAKEFVYETIRFDQSFDESGSWQDQAKKAVRKLFNMCHEESQASVSRNIPVPEEDDDIGEFHLSDENTPLTLKVQLEEEFKKYENLNFHLNTDKGEAIYHRQRWAQCKCVDLNIQGYLISRTNSI
jgi:hypothetical protein